MTDINFRASSIGRLMAEPKTKSEGNLSVGAKTFIRELAAQEILGIDFQVSSKPMSKGIACEETAIQLLNNVRGIWLTKNTERRTKHGITGECDLYDPIAKRGYDIKCSFSAATFPILPVDCINVTYEWQMRAYMLLWQADAWSVDYCLVDTPDHLIGYDPIELHKFWHIPERHRVTSWLLTRDAEKERKMIEKVAHAREYFAQVIEEFNETHKGMEK